MRFIFLRMISVTLLFTLLFTSCSTIERTVSLGVLTGATTGGLIAPSFVHKDKKNALLIGALIGSVVGGIGGYITHKKLEERDEKIKKEMLLNLDKHNLNSGPELLQLPTGPKAPSVLNPKVERVWVEPRIEGNKYLEGYFTWVIIDAARWSEKKKDEENDKEQKKQKEGKAQKELKENDKTNNQKMEEIVNEQSH
ncbi:MAG: hypothetical protein HQK51_13735 [Oligoflexia bacterium]|nr:hypothetical protein [Oligoflexia bacterium]